MGVAIEFYISDKLRNKTFNELNNFFTRKVCKQIEQGFYDYNEQYCQNNAKTIFSAEIIYRDCINNFLFNCEQNHRTIRKLMKKIEKKKYNPYNVAFLRPEELDEDNWSKILRRKMTTEEKLTNLATVKWRQCRRCQNTQYFFKTMQTRSSDEAMTIFYSCKKCGKEYKINN